MEEERRKKKRKNRLISFCCLGVFLISLVVATFSISKIVSEFSENKVLEKMKNQMLDEQAYQKSVNANLDNPDYYTAYYYGDYANYNMDDVLVIIGK